MASRISLAAKWLVKKLGSLLDDEVEVHVSPPATKKRKPNKFELSDNNNEVAEPP